MFYEVVSPVSNIPGDSWVEALIDEEKGAWKTELVCNVFLPHEADLIRGIALSANLPEDKQVWAPTTNGLFSVRSAYKLAMDLRPVAPVGDVSDGSLLRRFWQSVWSCNIPHKIRHFAWRACKDVLPTKENLVRRKVLSERITGLALQVIHGYAMVCGNGCPVGAQRSGEAHRGGLGTLVE
ncbi:hypothetical protein SO802_030187 [Lithocarpus litseifolius]|uniref:Reverse transcriptase zinc-binding domain-containing protein n=1 Tax=Lithocarpus litseifolius TaxID=425828 RepID=A0AAW2BWB5_9ROSI